MDKGNKIGSFIIWNGFLIGGCDIENMVEIDEMIKNEVGHEDDFYIKVYNYFLWDNNLVSVN